MAIPEAAEIKTGLTWNSHAKGQGLFEHHRHRQVVTQLDSFSMQLTSEKDLPFKKRFNGKMRSVRIDSFCVSDAKLEASPDQSRKTNRPGHRSPRSPCRTSARATLCWTGGGCSECRGRGRDCLRCGERRRANTDRIGAFPTCAWMSRRLKMLTKANQNEEACLEKHA